MRNFIALLLVIAVASAKVEREPRKFDPSIDPKRAEQREAVHEAAKFINEQTHIDVIERHELLKKLLKHEIEFSEVVKIIEQAPGSKNLGEVDRKYQMRVKEIGEKMSKLEKEMPPYLKEKLQERYQNRERGSGSL